MWSRDFERVAGASGWFAAVAAFVYAAAFLFARLPAPVSAALLVTGLFALPAIVGVYGRLRETDGGFALLALILGIIGALGAIIHGGYDLANALSGASVPDLPNAFDPRGLVTFGVSGLGTLLVSWLVLRGDAFPRQLGYLGVVLGVLLLVLYVGRLVIVDPSEPVIALPAVLTGLIVSPIWYAGIGSSLYRGITSAGARRASER